MATQSDATRGAAAQADYSKIRRPPEKDDVVLNAAALALLESVDESVRPKQLPVSFPRIVNRMAELWRKPMQMDRYFDELVTDARGNRQGFPLKGSYGAEHTQGLLPGQGVSCSARRVGRRGRNEAPIRPRRPCTRGVAARSLI